MILRVIQGQMYCCYFIAESKSYSHTTCRSNWRSGMDLGPHKTNYQICVSLQLRINPYQNKKERHYLHQYSSAYKYVLPGYAIATFNSKKKILTNFKTDVPLKRKYVNVKYVNTFIHVLLWDNINLHNL